VGIDFERASEKNISIIEEQLSLTEKRLLNNVLQVYSGAAAIFWTAKESLSKVLKNWSVNAPGNF